MDVMQEFAPALAWLLVPDDALPSVRYLALRDLLALPADDSCLLAAREQVMQSGAVPQILAHQDATGWWSAPGPGYEGKYTGTAHTVVLLALLGADGADPRLRAAGDYVLDHTRAPYGGFTLTGTNSGLIQCLQGNLCAALLDLGWWGDGRLAEAIDWLARSVTGEGIAPAEDTSAPVRYMRSCNDAPGFSCAANGRQPCAWGAVKVMIALSKLPASGRTPSVQAAIMQGIDFLLSRDPALADYPSPSGKPNGSWFKPGMPIGYVADVLQILEALAALGCADDPHLQHAYAWLLKKQAAPGRWLMEYTYNGKTWADIEQKGQPSKWVTLRALRVLQQRSAG